MNTAYHNKTVAPQPAESDPATLAVNQALVRWPYAVGALNRLGIDTCCGGNLSLREAAAYAGIAIGTILKALLPDQPAGKPTAERA